MNVKKFIDRPVLATVMSIFIVIAGVIGLFSLPVEQYPDIAPPTIMVSTSYPGANAETVQKSVIAPLEQAINGVENMTYMKSEATNTGSVSVNIFFKQGSDPDLAAINVQNRVAKAMSMLPAEVNQIGVTTAKRQSSMLKIFSLRSPNGTYDELFLSNYIKINIQPEILRISGVGDLMVFGPDYSMRVWLKPDVMAHYGLIPSDISGIMAEQNIEAAIGSLGESSGNTFQYTLKFRGRNVTTEEFEDLVVKSLPTGEILRLKDVARIELGKEDYNFKGESTGGPGCTAMVFQTAGSNATQVVEDIDAFLHSIERNLPDDVEVEHMMSTNDFLYASIRDVIKTLLEAILLVVLVVYIFLQDIRSTLVPTISIFVSLIGTFAALALFGFSINLLTLFALILAIGTVVDDAIVVVEAVQTRFDEGYKSAYLASVDAMKGLTSPIITTSLVFMAVFIPVTFMGGTAGVFYTQFGITMSVAVAISTLNALTLSPVLCALMLKPTPENGNRNFASRVRTAYNASYNRLLDKYKTGVIFFIRRKWLTWASLAVTVVVLLFLVQNTKTGLVPDEDMGVVFVNVSSAPGSSLSNTVAIMDKVEDAIKVLPQLKSYAKVSGYGMISGQGPSNGMFILKLHEWDDRPNPEDAVNAIKGRIYGMTAGITDAQIFVFAPGMIPGYGMGNGFEMHMQDKQGEGNIASLYSTTQQFLGELRKRPEIGSVYTSFNINYPQYVVDVDAAACKRKDISPKDVLSVLSGYMGGSYVSNFNRFTKVYRVMLQADPQYRVDEESLNGMYLRAGNGEMAPLSQFVTLTRIYGSESLARFNMYNSIAVNGAPADGYSSGEALKAIEETAEQFLPRGYGYDFGGISREESGATGRTTIIFAVCLIIVYLILAALYESYFIPVAVILSIPFGLMGSFLFAKMMGLENNIYLQTGLIMLIGLLAKTAILLTEYASEMRAQGMTIAASAYTAAKVRLRPILMTALTMIFGLLPMMLATGVGANGNSSLGSGVVGGMVIGTLALLFVVPTLFTIFQTLEERVRGKKMRTLKEVEESLSTNNFKSNSNA
ncbi:MAG: efflux RND transporter permease subunit [Marinifilaceae bacterium]